MIKKFLIVITIIIFFVAGFAFFKKGYFLSVFCQIFSCEQSNWKLYEDKEHNFSIQYPADASINVSSHSIPEHFSVDIKSDFLDLSFGVNYLEVHGESTEDGRIFPVSVYDFFEINVSGNQVMGRYFDYDKNRDTYFSPTSSSEGIEAKFKGYYAGYLPVPKSLAEYSRGSFAAFIKRSTDTNKQIQEINKILSTLKYQEESVVTGEFLD